MIRSKFVGISLILLGMLHIPVVDAEGPGDDVPGRFDEYEMLMLERPTLSLIEATPLEFPEGLVELWIRALKRQEPELQRLIIDTMAMAFAEDLQGLDVAIDELVKLASADRQDLDVLRAAVQTLIVLDVRDQQELFVNLALSKGAAVSEIVEPALADWKSKAMESAWVDRVQEQAASPSQMMLAIKGLAAINSAGANDALRSLVLNASALRKLRLAAAQTLGTVSRESQLELAAEFAKRPDSQVLDGLLAVAVISGNDSDEAVSLLHKLVGHQNSVVQSLALAHLFRVDSKLVEPHIGKLVDSSDVNVRRWCAKALVNGQKPGEIANLASLLNDVNPGLRAFVAESLVDYGKSAELKPRVLSEVEKVLAGKNWRGCEQACVVLGYLDCESAAGRMVELLGHPRADVKVASAWGLSQLRVAEVLPDMLDHAESVYQGLSSGELNARMPGVTYHLAHLIFAFGDQGFTDATPLLEKLVPKSYDYGEYPRPAAVWALGMFYKDQSDCEFIPSLVERLRDDEGMFPELELVRIMCAVSLGRMNAKSAQDALAEYAGDNDIVGSATRWGIEEITGEPVPLPPKKSTTNTKNQWFLTPLNANAG